jgi:hypothetical protein
MASKGRLSARRWTDGLVLIQGKGAKKKLNGLLSFAAGLA